MEIIKFYIVQKVLATINKKFGRPDSRLPTTQLILQQLLDSIQFTINSTYQKALLKAMFVTAFYGLFRVGEITSQKSGAVSINFDQISIQTNSTTGLNRL